MIQFILLFLSYTWVYLFDDICKIFRSFDPAFHPHFEYLLTCHRVSPSNMSVE